MEKLFLEMGEITKDVGEFSASTSRAMLDDVRARMKARYKQICTNCSDNLWYDS